MYKQSIMNIISVVRFLKLIYRLQARMIFYISYRAQVLYMLILKKKKKKKCYICLTAYKCVQNCTFCCHKIILDPHCLIIRVFSFPMYWVRVF